MATPQNRLPVARQYAPFAIGAALIIVAMVALGTLQLISQPRALQTTPMATEAATAAPAALQAPPTAIPVPSAAPRTIDAYAAPDGVRLGDFDPAGELLTFVGRYGPAWVQIQRSDSSKIWLKRAELQLDASDLSALERAPDLTPAAPQGRGLSDAPAVPVAPSYLENVGAQAPHSPRGDGQAGPSGGEWVAVPTVNPVQADVIRLQAPHKVR